MSITADDLYGQKEGYILDYRATDCLLAPPPSSALLDDDAPQPRMVAKMIDIPANEPIGVFALTVKEENSTIIALPDCFNFAVSAANTVANDLIQTLGSEGFKQRHIGFTIHAGPVVPQDVHIITFPEWHNHTVSNVDFAYVFTNTLPTEFRTETGQVVQPWANSLTRFGGEAVHRSPKNTTGAEIHRTFGVFIVHSRKPTENRRYPNPVNNVLHSAKSSNSSTVRAFMERAQARLADDLERGFKPMNRRVSSEPVALVV